MPDSVSADSLQRFRLILDALSMTELSVAEQRYQAVMTVIGDGLAITQAAEKVGVSRQTMHAWLARYEAEGLEGLNDRSHRPVRCPHQMPAEVEALLLELRRSHRYWGPRRLVRELAKRGVAAPPSASAAYRALLRAEMIDSSDRDRRSRKWKRWERGRPMELWQMDVVGGFALADGSCAKALTGIDDHSRMCVAAMVMARERTRPVCEGLRRLCSSMACPSRSSPTTARCSPDGLAIRRWRCCSTGSAGRTASNIC